MEIKVIYRGQERTLHLEGEKVKAKDILKALNLSRDYAFVVKNDQVVSEEETINPGDHIRVVNAISGGTL
jgi:sulfur carrier protein